MKVQGTNTFRTRRYLEAQQKNKTKRRYSFPTNNMEGDYKPNLSLIDQYKSFVKINPKLLPNSQVFNEINKIYSTFDIGNFNQKEQEKENALSTFFNPNQQVEQYLKDPENFFLQNTNNSFNITLQNNNNSNLYYFLTKILYFQKPDIFVNGKIEISEVKSQLGVDLHRAGNITINQELVPLSELLAFAQQDKQDEEVDYFNLRLIDNVNKQNVPITLNTINIIDLCCIQQNIQFISDLFIFPLAGIGVLQRGGDKKIDIIINKNSQNVIFSIVSNLINFELETWGSISGALNFDIKNLTYSYSFEINKNDVPRPTDEDPGGPFIESSLTANQNNNNPSTLQTYTTNISNVGKGALNYAKENPGTVAAGVGTAAILGSGVGALYLLGLLGGKTKKNKIRKNIYRKTLNKRKNKQKKNKQKKN